MIVRRGEISDRVHPYIEVESYKLKIVQEFKYLGSWQKKKKNDELTEIIARL
jgi:hypothetical protein